MASAAMLGRNDKRLALLRAVEKEEKILQVYYGGVLPPDAIRGKALKKLNIPSKFGGQIDWAKLGSNYSVGVVPRPEESSHVHSGNKFFKSRAPRREGPLRLEEIEDRLRSMSDTTIVEFTLGPHATPRTPRRAEPRPRTTSGLGATPQVSAGRGPSSAGRPAAATHTLPHRTPAHTSGVRALAVRTPPRHRARRPSNTTVGPSTTALRPKRKLFRVSSGDNPEDAAVPLLTPSPAPSKARHGCERPAWPGRGTDLTDDEQSVFEPSSSPEDINKARTKPVSLGILEQRPAQSHTSRHADAAKARAKAKAKAKAEEMLRRLLQHTKQQASTKTTDSPAPVRAPVLPSIPQRILEQSPGRGEQPAVVSAMRNPQLSPMCSIERTPECSPQLSPMCSIEPTPEYNRAAAGSMGSPDTVEGSPAGSSPIHSPAAASFMGSPDTVASSPAGSSPTCSPAVSPLGSLDTVERSPAGSAGYSPVPAAVYSPVGVAARSAARSAAQPHVHTTTGQPRHPCSGTQPSLQSAAPNPVPNLTPPASENVINFTLGAVERPSRKRKSLSLKKSPSVAALATPAKHARLSPVGPTMPVSRTAASPLGVQPARASPVVPPSPGVQSAETIILSGPRRKEPEKPAGSWPSTQLTSWPSTQLAASARARACRWTSPPPRAPKSSSSSNSTDQGLMAKATVVPAAPSSTAPASSKSTDVREAKPASDLVASDDSSSSAIQPPPALARAGGRNHVSPTPEDDSADSGLSASDRPATPDAGDAGEGSDEDVIPSSQPAETLRPMRKGQKTHYKSPSPDCSPIIASGERRGRRALRQGPPLSWSQEERLQASRRLFTSRSPPPRSPPASFVKRLPKSSTTSSEQAPSAQASVHGTGHRTDGADSKPRGALEQATPGSIASKSWRGVRASPGQGSDDAGSSQRGALEAVTPRPDLSRSVSVASNATHISIGCASPLDAAMARPNMSRSFTISMGSSVCASPGQGSDDGHLTDDAGCAGSPPRAHRGAHGAATPRSDLSRSLSVGSNATHISFGRVSSEEEDHHVSVRLAAERALLAEKKAWAGLDMSKTGSSLRSSGANTPRRQAQARVEAKREAEIKSDSDSAETQRARAEQRRSRRESRESRRSSRAASSDRVLLQTASPTEQRRSRRESRESRRSSRPSSSERVLLRTTSPASAPRGLLPSAVPPTLTTASSSAEEGQGRCSEALQQAVSRRAPAAHPAPLPLPPKLGGETCSSGSTTLSRRTETAKAPSTSDSSNLDPTVDAAAPRHLDAGEDLDEDIIPSSQPPLPLPRRRLSSTQRASPPPESSRNARMPEAREAAVQRRGVKVSIGQEWQVPTRHVAVGTPARRGHVGRHSPRPNTAGTPARLGRRGTPARPGSHGTPGRHGGGADRSHQARPGTPIPSARRSAGSTPGRAVRSDTSSQRVTGDTCTQKVSSDGTSSDITQRVIPVVTPGRPGSVSHFPLAVGGVVPIRRSTSGSPATPARRGTTRAATPARPAGSIGGHSRGSASSSERAARHGSTGVDKLMTQCIESEDDFSDFSSLDFSITPGAFDAVPAHREEDVGESEEDETPDPQPGRTPGPAPAAPRKSAGVPVAAQAAQAGQVRRGQGLHTPHRPGPLSIGKRKLLDPRSPPPPVPLARSPPRAASQQQQRPTAPAAPFVAPRRAAVAAAVAASDKALSLSQSTSLGDVDISLFSSASTRTSIGLEVWTTRREDADVPGGFLPPPAVAALPPKQATTTKVPDQSDGESTCLTDLYSP